MKTQKWLSIACLILGFCGLGGGATLAAWAERREDVEGQWVILALGGMMSLAGIICLILPVKGGGLFLRRYLGSRLDDLQSNPDVSEVFYVGLEDPATFSQLKVTSDDAGYLALDPVNRRVIIEGVLCRYVIRQDDVVQVKSQFANGSPGTHIVYRIGTTSGLGIMIEKQSLRAETIRQLTGRARNPACDRIAETLGVTAST